MRKHLRAAAMMVGVMASGGVWASSSARDDGGEERAEDRRSAVGVQLSPEDLPVNVQERIQQAYPDAAVVSAERWGAGYEATLVSGLRRHELLLDHAGNIVEHHVAVPIGELPPAVRATVDRTWPRHTLWRATRIETDIGNFHEILLARGEQRAAVVIDPEARVLAGLKRG